VLERPNDVKICTYVSVFDQTGLAGMQNITQDLRLKNYSVFMDFAGMKAVYLFRRVPGR
jgi:hypothetical protein